MKSLPSILLGLISVCATALRDVLGQRGLVPTPRHALFVCDAPCDGVTERLEALVGGEWRAIAEDGAGIWQVVNLIRGRLCGNDVVVVMAGRQDNNTARSQLDVAYGLTTLYGAARDNGVQNVVAVAGPWLHDGIRAWQKDGAQGFVDEYVYCADGDDVAECVASVFDRGKR